MSEVRDDRYSNDAGLMDGPRVRHRVSWGALISGVVLAFSLQLLLSLLGGAIGSGSFGGGGGPSAETLGLASGVWWIVSSCIAIFAGGYAAAWLAGVESRFGGALHGLVTWSVVTLLTVYLISTAVGSLIGGGFSALGSVTSSVGSGVKDAAAPVANSLGLSPDAIKQQAGSYLQPASSEPSTMTPQDAQKEVAKGLVTYAQGGPDAPAAKARIVDIMASQLKISQAEASQRFDVAQRKVNETVAAAKTKATDAADAAASAAAKGTLALFVDLILGAVAAALGGALALDTRRRIAPARVA